VSVEYAKNVNLIWYLPPFVAKYLEIKKIMDTEDPEFCFLWEAARKARNDIFIVSAEEYGLSRWEKILGIAVKSGENLEFRRWRVLELINIKTPFSLRWLKQKLDGMLGAGNWALKDDFLNYDMRIDATLTLQELEVLRQVLAEIIPCNLSWFTKNTMHTTLGGQKRRAIFGLQYRRTRLGDAPPGGK
jgi:hypothetical protein